MSTHQEVRIDERTVAVLHAANTWGLNFITFALFIDIIYRAVVRKEAAWDLFALVGVSGAISTLYLARQKVLGQVFGWKVVIVFTVVAFVLAAVSAFLVTWTKAM